MALIGKLTRQTDGSYKGEIATLTISRRITMRPIDSTNPEAPKFRVFAGYGECGAAFEQAAKDTGEVFLSIKLDDPTFAKPLYAAAFPNKEKPDTELDLVWSRSEARD